MNKIIKNFIAIFSIFILTVTSTTGSIKAASGSKLLTYKSKLDTTFDIEIDITATFSNKKWIDVSSIEPSIDSNSIVHTYKIVDNTLTCSVTSSKIVLKGGLKINIYYGIAGFGIIKARTYNYSVDKTFLASNYL